MDSRPVQTVVEEVRAKLWIPAHEMSPEEAGVLSELRGLVLAHPQPDRLADELLAGAHVVLLDQGALYDRLAPFSRERGSTHYKDRILERARWPHREVEGPWLRACLFGRHSAPDGSSFSWIQLENTPDRPTWAGPWSLYCYCKHRAVDWVWYKLSGRNVGPYGTSVHTESNPIRILSDSP